ncbi:MAG: STAS domain-containing protein [Candidatus Theseobacter exili]|nr:STAS domain-containing protein [Candidatus Theseobacter exili]
MDLNVNVEQKKEGIYLITLEGKLDTNTYLSFEETIKPILIHPSTKALILDMEKLNYISSAGFRIILMAKKTIAKNNGKVITVNLQPQIQEVFNLVNILPKTDIFDSIESADMFLDAVQRKELTKDTDFTT